LKTPALSELSEDQLLTLAQSRDEAAFAELMARNSSSSLKLALSILKDRQDSEDEVQNSYWNAWRYLGHFRRDSRFSTWISRIVMNQCLMRLRKLRKASFVYLDESSGDGGLKVLELRGREPSPEATFSRSELSETIRREIDRLVPILRNVLALRDLDELPMDDVARQLGITLVAAKSRLMRARWELRRRMERHHHPARKAPAPA
jgi:RNA polymerase sigma-70 factor (ECF subfamily)